jgi:hypothetical protein
VSGFSGLNKVESSAFGKANNVKCQTKQRKTNNAKENITNVTDTASLPAEIKLSDQLYMTEVLQEG